MYTTTPTAMPAATRRSAQGQHRDRSARADVVPRWWWISPLFPRAWSMAAEFWAHSRGERVLVKADANALRRGVAVLKRASPRREEEATTGSLRRRSRSLLRPSRIRGWRQHGWYGPTRKRHKPELSLWDWFPEPMSQSNGGSARGTANDRLVPLDSNRGGRRRCWPRDPTRHPAWEQMRVQVKTSSQWRHVQWGPPVSDPPCEKQPGLCLVSRWANLAQSAHTGVRFFLFFYSCFVFPTQIHILNSNLFMVFT
jgi:hypothetical protein